MPADPPPPELLAHRVWLRRQLLHWFARHARDLPWRHNRDPYRIWISEIMLQQTQVATVIPFFKRFLARFPTLTALAQASEHDVLRAWEGLGYYRRARDLYRSAQALTAAQFTTIPDDEELLRTLPGFGRYTANAVLSQAYERRLPILEANSIRVLCRLFAIDDDPKQTSVQKTLWKYAEELLPKKSIGAFNQAMMELGALVCTPTQPACERCPLRQHCQARLQQRQEEIPRRAKSLDPVAVEEVALVVRHKDKVLLVQRPAAGRWGNMWECPHQPVEWMESHAAAAQRLLTALGIEATITGEITTIRHSVTRFRIQMVCLAATLLRGKINPDVYPQSAWVRVDEMDHYPLSMPQRALAKRLQAKSSS